MSGLYVGQALGGLGGYIADASSWRNAFYWFGGVGLLYAGVLLLFLRDAPNSSAEKYSASSSISVRDALTGVLGVSSFLILAVYFTLPAMPGWAIKSWLPTHLAAAFAVERRAIEDELRGLCLVQRQPCIGDRRDGGIALSPHLETVRALPAEDAMRRRAQFVEKALDIGFELIVGCRREAWPQNRQTERQTCGGRP